MPLTVPCRRCKHKFQVSSKLAGQAVRCSACGHSMTLPPLQRILQKKAAKAVRKGPESDDELVPMELADEESEFDVEEVADQTATAGTVFVAAETVPLACPHCDGPLAYEPALAGQVVACPYCAGHLQMPRL